MEENQNTEHSTSEEEVSTSTWIDEFLKSEIDSILLKVPIEYIMDKFNLVGLSRFVPNFDKAHKVVLNLEDEEPNLETRTLYHMIHQRYVYTKAGLEEMFERVMRMEFGGCRNVICATFPLIPTGLTDIPGSATIKLYCHNCKNLFNPKGPIDKLDSCVFGRSFAPFMVLTYKNSFKKRQYRKYTPRIFGFRIFEEE